MRMTGNQFRAWKQKSITLLGMSGVGKTALSSKLRQSHWYHYSGDYRIGSHYLDEAMLDNIKKQAIHVPLLRELLLSDSITISNKLAINNLKPIATFLGKIGNPELGGLAVDEFKHRQALHRQAEIASMLDVPLFIERSRNVYGYNHFVNDAGGSVCELDEPSVLQTLSDCSVILYIKAGKSEEEALVKRQAGAPKPMYYREKFLEEHLEQFMQERQLEYAAMVDPNEFVIWIFPQLFYARIPRYENIAQEHGYVISTDEVSKVSDESSFVELVSTALDRNKS